MNPFYQSVNPEQTKFYPAEYEKMGCVVDSNLNLEYDPRYTRSGFHTDQKSLRSDSNVLETM